MLAPKLYTIHFCLLPCAYKKCHDESLKSSLFKVLELYFVTNALPKSFHDAIRTAVKIGLRSRTRSVWPFCRNR